MRILLFIGSIDFIMSLVGYIYYRQSFAFARSWIFGICFWLLAVNTAISVVLPPSTPLLITRISAWLEGLWIAFGYYTLLVAALHGLAWLIAKALGVHLPNSKIAIIGLLCIACFVAWGSWRAFHPTVRTEQLVTDKLPAGTSYKIVFLTDIHLGRILGYNYAATLAARVNSLQPDLVLIAGDIIDEKIFYVTQQDSLGALARISAPLGTYMSYGNHEYIDNPALWGRMLEERGIHVLKDVDVILDDKLKITGIDDWVNNRTTDSIFALSAANDKYYSIIMDHQPRRLDAAAQAGYDLYLAGHTHTGQLFPNRLVTKRMYKLDYGRSSFGSLTAITSNGYGFWGPPVRTEVAPEIVVLELRGK